MQERVVLLNGLRYEVDVDLGFALRWNAAACWPNLEFALTCDVPDIVLIAVVAVVEESGLVFEELVLLDVQAKRHGHERGVVQMARERRLKPVGDETELEMGLIEVEGRSDHLAGDGDGQWAWVALDFDVEHFVELTELFAVEGDLNGLVVVDRNHAECRFEVKRRAERRVRWTEAIVELDEALVGEHDFVGVCRADIDATDVEQLK